MCACLVSLHQRMCMRSKAWLAASVSLRLARLPTLSRTLWLQNSESLPYIATLCRTLVRMHVCLIEWLRVDTFSLQCTPPPYSGHLYCTTGYLSFHPMAQCFAHALKDLAFLSSVLFAHAVVTKITIFSMGPNLRYPPRYCMFGAARWSCICVHWARKSRACWASFTFKWRWQSRSGIYRYPCVCLCVC